jgi:hypothetical protein
MATKFERVVDAIKTQLDSDWPDNSVEFTKGRLLLRANDDSNRVGWVRIGGRATELDGAGPKQHPSDADPLVTVSSSAILTDTYQVEAFVWGQDADTADRIREAVIRAAHKTLSNRTAEAGRWEDKTETEEEAAWETLGAYHRIEFVFRVPILENENEQEIALLTSHSETIDYVTQATLDAIVDDKDLTGPP